MEESRTHVAVLAFPFGSHAAPLFAILRRLAALYPTTYFSFFSTSESNKSVLSAYQHDILFNNIRVCDVWDGVPQGYVFLGKPQEEIELFMRAAPNSFRNGIERAVDETGANVNCLITDAFFWFAAKVAADMKVPWLAFWTAGPNSLSAHLHTDLIRKSIGVGGLEDGALDLIPGMSRFRIRDLPEGVIFGNLESLFSNMLHKMGLVLPQATAVFINSFEELEPVLTKDLKSKLKTFLNIGPFNLISAPPPAPDTYGCLSWLDKQKVESVVYISFGSVTAPPADELKALAEGLEASNVPFLWSLKDKPKTNLPNGFLEKTKYSGMVVPWAPQMEVLRHSGVGVFISHCGWNSLLESIVGGVPMINRPFFGDQRLNGRMVEDVLEIGINVEGGVFTKDGVMKNLDMVLSQERGKVMRKKVRTIQERGNDAVGIKGSSTICFNALLDLVSSP